MEAALVSVATGALKPVLDKLAALLCHKYARFKGLRKDIKSLAHELAAMDAFLMKMSEEEEPDVQDQVWMNEVRELSYGMEDCIDDFMQSVDDKDIKPDGFIEKMKHSLGKLGKMKARRRIGNEIHDLKKQITEVGDRNARYKTRQGYVNTKNATVDPRALVIFEHASNLIGLDEPKAEMMKLLIKQDVHAPTKQKPKIVSIVGSGGMGKTTLADQVYQELKGDFICQAFISVSRNPDMMNILRTIFSKVSNQHYGNTQQGSVQQLIMNINEFLLDKRYFVVVDDIWDVETWDVIKAAFPINNFGSIIITTTRMRNVAHSCCSSFDGHVYKIRHLNMVHSRQLFHRRLFNTEENCPSYLEDASEQILEKCAGLPLAIIAVSGLLANMDESEHLWNEVKDSIGRALERNASVELMMKILSLSYYDLPAHLKTCLLYLSMYKEDSIIEKKGIIRRWIGEGFIHRENRYTRHELAERYLNDLLNRSSIQPEKTNRYGKLKSFRVHDTVLDFITSKSTEENFVTLVDVPNVILCTQEKVRRLSLRIGQEGSSKVVLSQVRSLSVSGNCSEIPSLDEFKHLRVLHFEICRQLKNYHFVNIGRLLQLRYLNLQGVTGLSELPEQIGDLKCLEMLDLRDMSIHKLPATIVNLRKLVDLLVDSGVNFPEGIAKMQSLEVLKQVKVFEQPFKFLLELGQLKNLKKLVLDFENHSDIAYTMGNDERMEIMFTSLCNLATQNLRSLKVFFCGDILDEPSFPTLLSLQKIKTSHSPVLRVPDWVGSLVNLHHLCLEVVGVWQEDLFILGGLRSLHILYLRIRMDKKIKDFRGKKRLTVSGAVGFQCLRQFFYYSDFWMDLVFAAGSMPKLEKLELASFNILETECLDFGIQNLPSLITVKCALGGDEHIVKAVRTAMERAVTRHPNHPTLD